MARKLHIAIKDKVATYSQRDGIIVCGNSDYVIEFAFDSEWDGHNTKTARFISNGSFEDVVFTGNTVAVPVMRNTTSVSVGVFSGDLTTSTPAVIGCEKSILCEGGIPSDPTDDVYNQIIDLLNKGGGSGGGTGSDDYSPTIEVTKLTNGHLLTITDKNGTQTVTVTNGTDGTDGTDGFSPRIKVTTISGGHRITITDVNGTQYFDVMDGSSGGSGTSVIVGSDKPTSACLWFNTSGYEAETVTHKVTYTLSNCFSREGGDTIVVAGESFQDEIYEGDGYTLFCVTVLMGGVEIYKSQPYNEAADGGIWISSVTGDVEIIAEALVAYSLTKNLTNCNSAPSSIIFDGDYRTVSVGPMPGYEIKDENVTITMGGVDITDDAWEGDGFYIQKATGDVVATIVATPITYTVTYNLTNCESREGGENCEVAEGSAYQDTIAVNDGYTLESVSVTMGGIDITSTAYDSDSGDIYIGSVVGDIVITATANVTEYHAVTYNCDENAVLFDKIDTVAGGETLHVNVTAKSGYIIESISATMGSINETASPGGAGTTYLGCNVTSNAMYGCVSIASGSGGVTNDVMITVVTKSTG